MFVILFLLVHYHFGYCLQKLQLAIHKSISLNSNILYLTITELLNIYHRYFTHQTWFRLMIESNNLKKLKIKKIIIGNSALTLVTSTVVFANNSIDKKQTPVTCSKGWPKTAGCTAGTTCPVMPGCVCN